MTTTRTSTTPVVTIRKLAGTFGGWATALLGTDIAVYATQAEIRTQWRLAKD